MTLATLDRVTYSYPRAVEPAIRAASLAVAESEFSLVAGPSGGGKSTLLRLFNGLVPQFHGGAILGSVQVSGLDAIRTPTRQLSLVAGMVFQEPEAQSVAETVIEEVAFGMEQRAIPHDEMHRRSDHLLAELGIEHLRNRRQQTLSGGERQRVAIAAVLAMQPRLLLLDEPTSQLDEDGARSLLSAIVALRQRGDLAVLVAEHRLDRLMEAADRVIQVERGVVQSLTPESAVRTLEAVPVVAALCRALGVEPEVHPGSAATRLPSSVIVRQTPMPSPGELLMRARGIGVAYGEHVALRDATFDLREGEIVALMGPNGSGKSSLFRAITGLTRPFAGEFTFPKSGRVQPKSPREVTRIAGFVPQDPSLALYRETVRQEITETLSHRRGRHADAVAVDAALAEWGIVEFSQRNPRDISVGQQQRVAVAAMLAHRPPIWLLDEPTRGADEAAKGQLAARLRSHAAAGGAAIVATHDLESAAHFATRVLTLRTGEVVSDLPARAAFAADGPHPTQVAKLVPGAITVEEVSRG